MEMNGDLGNCSSEKKELVVVDLVGGNETRGRSRSLLDWPCVEIYGDGR